jgi:predicted PurR-regulated permease PerM
MPSRLPWPLVFQVVGVVAVIWLVVHTPQIWFILLISLVLAAAILPAARALERFRIPRGLTVLGIYIAGAGVLTAVGRLLWPALREQSQQFMDQLPRMVENVERWLGTLRLWAQQWGASIPTPKSESVEGALAAVLGNTMAFTAGAVGAVVGFIAILVVTAYLVIDAEALGRGLLRLLPPQHRREAAALAPPMLDRMGAYVRGQLAVSLCVGAMLAVALSLIGVKYALLIGALAAVLNVVPWVGSLVASILGILSALDDSFGLALLTAGVFIGSNLVEGKMLVPYLVGRATGLHPLSVLLALLAGAHLAGLLGALVAVPLMAAAWEVVDRIYVRRNGD